MICRWGGGAYLFPVPKLDINKYIIISSSKKIHSRKTGKYNAQAIDRPTTNIKPTSGNVTSSVVLWIAPCEAIVFHLYKQQYRAVQKMITVVY